MSLDIGPHHLTTPLILAPMAGFTDHPFRSLCRQLGAGLAVSEMVTVQPRLRQSLKTSWRLAYRGEPEPHSVQIVGNDPAAMAVAARQHANEGAQIIDINMGCPVKKVCNKAAGSALLRNESLVGRILESVVAAVEVPVTLKIRTGWSPESRNAVTIARIAESSGIQALTIHGRTRACGFRGQAEYHTASEVKQSVTIPIIANGDIDSPESARHTLQQSGADGLMIGRAAVGRPWIFREIAYFLETGEHLAPPTEEEIALLLLSLLDSLYDFYGENRGHHIARKHIGAYLKNDPATPPYQRDSWRRRILTATSASTQRHLVEQLFDHKSAWNQAA